MLNIQKIESLRTAADRRQFVLGATDSNGLNIRALAVGIVAGMLLFKGNKK